MLIDIPKIMHFYWDKSSLSYLQYMTIISFNKFNPDWEVIIHEPKKQYSKITWLTHEQQVKFTNENYYHSLKLLSFVKFNEVDFDKIGFNEKTPEVFKSDYLRWYLLSTIGGGWSDMDILYLKSIEEINNNIKFDTLICHGEHGHIIGFLLSKPNNPFFKKIFDSIKTSFNKKDYQSIGSKILNELYPTIESIWEQKLDIQLSNMSMNVFYPINHMNIEKYFKFISIDDIKNDTVGVHWYNGSKIAKDFNNTYSPSTSKTINTITKLLKRIR